MEENPYKAPVECGAPAREASASRVSPVVGVACCGLVATCASIMLSPLNQSLDLSAYVFIALHAIAWAVSAVAAFANRKRVFYVSLLFDAAVFFSLVIFVALVYG